MKKLTSILLLMTLVSATSAFALELRGQPFEGSKGFNRINYGRRSGIYNLSAQHEGTTQAFGLTKTGPIVALRNTNKIASDEAAGIQFSERARHIGLRNFDRKTHLQPRRNVRTFASNETKRTINAPKAIKARLGLKPSKGGLTKTQRVTKLGKNAPVAP